MLCSSVCLWQTRSSWCGYSSDQNTVSTYNSDDSVHNEHHTNSPYSSPFQQACPFTISDFDSDSQHTIENDEDSNETQDSNETVPLRSTDKTPELHRHTDVLPQQNILERKIPRRRPHMRVLRWKSKQQHVQVQRNNK